MGQITHQYVIDTNIFIYHLNNCLGRDGQMLLEQALLAGSFVSIITRIELLSWHKHTEDSFNAASELLNNLTEQPLNEDIAQGCIKLRKKYRLKVPDALIAATALQLKLPLITRNVDDYKNVSGLKLVNPFTA